MTQFIQIGTSEMYGSVKTASKETDPICLSSSPYAASKVAFDMYLLSVNTSGLSNGILSQPLQRLLFRSTSSSSCLQRHWFSQTKAKSSPCHMREANAEKFTSTVILLERSTSWPKVISEARSLMLVRINLRLSVMSWHSV